MGKAKKMPIWCPFPDCFSCPHPDCIKTIIYQPMPNPGSLQKPPEVKKIDALVRRKQPKRYADMTEEQKAARRASKAKWRKNNPDKVAAGKKDYYQRNREKILAYHKQRRIDKKQKELRDDGQKHLPDSQTGQRSDPGASS